MTELYDFSPSTRLDTLKTFSAILTDILKALEGGDVRAATNFAVGAQSAVQRALKDYGEETTQKAAD